MVCGLVIMKSGLAWDWLGQVWFIVLFCCVVLFRFLFWLGLLYFLGLLLLACFMFRLALVRSPLRLFISAFALVLVCSYLLLWIYLLCYGLRAPNGFASLCSALLLLRSGSLCLAFLWLALLR